MWNYLSTYIVLQNNICNTENRIRKMQLTKKILKIPQR